MNNNVDDCFLRRDLRARVADLTHRHPEAVDSAAEHVFHALVDEVTLGICFDLHRSVKTGTFAVMEVPEPKSQPSPTANAGYDVFGNVITTTTGVPMLKKQPECICPNCQRNMAASRFAPHLEKCMGMGRNSSRIASRRLAKDSKEGAYREAGGNEEDDDAEDEDWVEPQRQQGAQGQYGAGGQSASGSARRKRDKNSPRRTRGGGRSGMSSAKTSGETTPQDGSVTPPTSFDQLTVEERSQLLSSICGVVSANSRKICSRSTRCPVHSDAQRREVRVRWLGDVEGGEVDIDGFSEGDTAALRESLAQLSNASSPAESVISTCSNPPPMTAVSTRQRREKTSRRGHKKGKPGSKGGSRGSTPPLMHLD